MGYSKGSWGSGTVQKPKENIGLKDLSHMAEFMKPHTELLSPFKAKENWAKYFCYLSYFITGLANRKQQKIDWWID